MDHLIIGLAAAAAAGLTFFSGFGLGTLLLPVFALFFSVDLAVALTAIVHFLNNVLKLVLLGGYAERKTLISFGAFAIAGAYGGAEVLLWLSDFEPLAAYRLGGLEARVTPVKVAVSALLIVFTLADVVPQREIKAFGRSHLVMGGLLSRFFGGLSGHQGALRSAFLIRAGLTKEQFLGTSVVLACLVDAARLSVYAAGLSWEGLRGESGVLLTAAGAAFLGTLLGNRFLPQVAFETIRAVVSALIVGLALGLGAGIL